MGRTAFSRFRWKGKMCFMYQSSVVGMLTKRIDSAVGAASSTMTS
jgi:hypothetical protein